MVSSAAVTRGATVRGSRLSLLGFALRALANDTAFSHSSLISMTRTTPLVSIGLPVYNGERYLREALDSLLTQTFADFELILSDNCSTDGTADICREYAAQDNQDSIRSQ